MGCVSMNVWLCFISLWVSSLVAGEIPWASRQGREDGWTSPPRGSEGEFEDIAREMASLAESLLQVLWPGLDGLRDESQCLVDFDKMFNTTDPFSNVSQGALALDAFGKPGPNILYGNIHLAGSYDECLDIGGGGLTKYCVLSLNITQPNVTFLMDICVPQSCNVTDIVNMINRALQAQQSYDLSLVIGIVSCSESKTIPYNAGAIVMIVVCAIFLALAFIGSTVDIGVKALRELSNKPGFSFKHDHTYDIQSEKSPLLGKPLDQHTKIL